MAAINIEWIINKAKEKIYAVSHAKAVVRGDHTVDDDLTSLEENLNVHSQNKTVHITEAERNLWNTVDDELDDESTRPLMNKVLKGLFDNKVDIEQLNSLSVIKTLTTQEECDDPTLVSGFYHVKGVDWKVNNVIYSSYSILVIGSKAPGSITSGEGCIQVRFKQTPSEAKDVPHIYYRQYYKNYVNNTLQWGSFYLLNPNYYDWSKCIQVEKNTDLNTLLHAGIYYVSKEVATTLSNSPETSHAFSIRIYRDGLRSEIQHIMVWDSTGSEYKRATPDVTNTAAWSTWKSSNNSIDSNINTYSNPAQFGKNLSDTAQDIWNALPSSSVLVVSARVLSSGTWNFPDKTSYHTLVMIKYNDSRIGGIFLYPKNSEEKTYCAYLTSDNQFNSVWYNIADGGDANTLDGKHESDFIKKNRYQVYMKKTSGVEFNSHYFFGSVTPGENDCLYITNASNSDMIVKFNCYSSQGSVTFQTGYGTGSLPDMPETGNNRDAFNNYTIDKTFSPEVLSLTIPTGKTGYICAWSSGSDAATWIINNICINDPFDIVSAATEAMNADTVDGKHASEFLQNITQWTSGSVKDHLLATKTSGVVWINKSCTDLPTNVSATWWYGIVLHSVTHYCLIVTNINNNSTFAITYNAGTTPPSWTNWRDLSNGGNAIMVNGHTVQSDVPANAKFTDTTYKAGSNIAIDSNNVITNTGVIRITSKIKGAITYECGGSLPLTADIAINGLGSAAYQGLQTNAATVGIHRMSAGTAEANNTNCPAGCWYGQYE